MRYEHNLSTGEVTELPDLAPVTPTEAELFSQREAKLSLVRSTREAILNRLTGIERAASLTGDAATSAAYLVVRQGLLDITDGLKELAPELIDGTVMQRYVLLRGACTPAMVSAFAQVDA